MKQITKITIIFCFPIVFFSCENKTYKVEKSIEIKAPIEEIFIQINNHRNRKNWSPWEKKDPNQISEYNYIENGKGAFYSWKGNDSVGTGTLEIIESIPFSKIESKLTFTAPWESTSSIYWNFEKQDTIVKTTWSTVGEMPQFMLWFMDMEEIIGPDFEQGLQNLKKYCEENTNKFKMNEIIVDSQAYLTIRESINLEQDNSYHGRIYGQIANYIVQNGGIPSPKPIAIYYTNTEGKTDVELGIAVNQEYKGTKNIKYKMMNQRKALVASHFGSYTNLGITYASIMKFIETNKIRTSGAPWEEYVSDPSLELDSNKWETKIYFPIL